ncbi:MAG: porin family protein [Epsilonproteobacteria bacterium]|nr:porin family protein [Campylobacterota bacterium]
MKLTNLLVSVAFCGVSLFASEVITQENQEHHKELTPYYVALKGMYSFGDDYTNDEGIKEEGDTGYGVGLDVGYIFYEKGMNGFAIELDITYETADVTFHEEEEKVTHKADYYTTSLDLVYMIKPIEQLGLFAKVGYEYEYEEIADETANEDDFIVAAGIEYHLSHHYRGIVEYEHSFIDGPKGDVVFAGIVYNF